MTLEEGALFLLRRANMIEPQAQLDSVDKTDRTQAITISDFYSDEGKYAEAKVLYQRASALGEQVLGPQHPENAPLSSYLWGRHRE